MTPCVVALQSMRSFTKTQYSMTQKAVYFVAAPRSNASRRISGLVTMTFGISQSVSPRERATAGACDEWRAAPVRRPQANYHGKLELNCRHSWTVEKMVDETGIEPATSSLRTVGKIS